MSTITDYLTEALAYAWPLGNGQMPFDRQLHWHRCYHWTKPGHRHRQDPAVTVAEDRYSNPTLWDLELDSAHRQWVDELAAWPRRYDPE